MYWELCHEGKKNSLHLVVRADYHCAVVKKQTWKRRYISLFCPPLLPSIFNSMCMQPWSNMAAIRLLYVVLSILFRKDLTKPFMRFQYFMRFHFVICSFFLMLRQRWRNKSHSVVTQLGEMKINTDTHGEMDIKGSVWSSDICLKAR